jgi:transcription elongation factor GreB
MSKAFTREDADASFDVPAPSARLSEARLTAYGARVLRERLAALEHEHEHTGAAEQAASERTSNRASEHLRDLLETAEVLEPAGAEHVALGARVRTQSDSGVERTVVIVTPDEVGLVPAAISAASPLAQALLGATVGQTVELELPRGPEELTVVAIEWPR